MAAWHYVIGSERNGPVSDNRLLAMIARDELSPDVLVWRDGQAEWIPARETREIGAAVRRVTPVPAPQAAPPPLPRYPLARPWPRFLARVFDLLLLYIPAIFVLSLAAFALPEDIVDLNPLLLRAASGDLSSVFSLILLVQLVSFAILALITAAFGTSLGKLIFGVRVAPLLGQKRLGFHLEREFTVWLRGLALSIVPASIVTAILQYRRVSDGQPAGYDERKARVEGKPISGVRLAGGIVATLLAPILLIMLFTVVLNQIPMSKKDLDVPASTRWMNPETLGEARFDRPFKADTFKGAGNVNTYFEAQDLSVTMLFEHDINVGTGVGSAEYARTWDADLQKFFTVTSPWRPLTIDGKRAYRASAASVGNAAGDIELTFVLTDAGAWRIVVYAGAAKLADLDIERNVTALFETID
ncbi:RDD family protein [Ensifer sp. ENS09]|uniref:RDD family protein n=1 Tax=Ensifer sp. ENS09 TaxID=2769263 RepID=UPI001786C6C7|nr:RDD family protein [Ensifer sp. ENS09]MBD9647461.1 RDD family protein [Ensifer sp. ENS09]